MQISYAFVAARILYQNGEAAENSDPLPILMGYGRVLDDGPWLGDIVGVANEMPDGYELLKEIHLDW